MSPLKVLASTGAQPPVRMAFMFVPNGVHLQEWKPTATGAHYDLPRILKSLSPVKRDITVLSGLTQDKARANGDGPGDHARCAGVFPTGVQPLKRQGSATPAGVSVDQVASKKIGHKTLVSTLYLGSERGRPSRNSHSDASPYNTTNI